MKRVAGVWIALGAVNGALAVALAAAASHGLKAALAANDPTGLFSTALDMHRTHALALVLAGLAAAWQPRQRAFAWAGALFLMGLLLFCGNLYLRSLAGVHDFHAVTPFGGGAFILGWLAFAAGGFLAAKK